MERGAPPGCCISQRSAQRLYETQSCFLISESLVKTMRGAALLPAVNDDRADAARFQPTLRLSDQRRSDAMPIPLFVDNQSQQPSVCSVLLIIMVNADSDYTDYFSYSATNVA
jgi:hypothetical protein